jgi:hypothetical protein
MAGNIKTNDLPLPVKAIPIISLPNNTSGIAYIYIGVGFMIFFI